MNDDDPQLLRLSKAAEMLTCSERTLRRIIADTGQVAPGVPVIYIGTMPRVPRKKLEAFVAGEVNENDNA